MSVYTKSRDRRNEGGGLAGGGLAMTRVGQSPETDGKLGKYRRQLASTVRKKPQVVRDLVWQLIVLNKGQEKNEGISTLDNCKAAEQS